MKYLILLALIIGCSQDNEIEQSATKKILKIREATIDGGGVYYLKLEHAKCYVYYNGGIDCNWNNSPIRRNK